MEFKQPVSKYDEFYAKGGWNYNIEKEKNILINSIIKPLDLKPCKMLDFGCGMGHHADMWRGLGFDIVGIDLSSVAIEYARKHYPGIKFIHADASKYKFNSKFDIIFARGTSFYHYDLSGTGERGKYVLKVTKDMFDILKGGGLFILFIRTNFSGNKDERGAYNNRIEDYVYLFSRFGTIVKITDYDGKIINKDSRGIIITTRKGRDYYG